MASTRPPSFPGFPAFQSNVTYTPRQFFTLVLPHFSRGVVRIVGYAIRQILGWVDSNGNPTKYRVALTNREIVEYAGVSRDSIAMAITEAVLSRCLKCLQPPHPDEAGKPGQTGIYELCWDKSGEYTNDPSEFQGFYYREAVNLPGTKSARGYRGPTAARKNIPNAFFDRVVRYERLSVIRVVGALLYYSIQWGPAGERKEPVRKSVAELARLARMSERHVCKALQEAQQKGYIEKIKPGVFDPQGGHRSCASTYAIRWIEELPKPLEVPREPVRNGTRRETTQSMKPKVEPSGKGLRHMSEKVRNKESEMVHDITAKKGTNGKNNNLKEPPPATDASQSGEKELNPMSMQLLLECGFDSQTARKLAQSYDEDRIRRQIEWLKLRAPKRNALGMLRRSIEGDWTPPLNPTTDQNIGSTNASAFVNAYYAAYQAYSGPATIQPPARDIEAAEPFLAQIQGIPGVAFDPESAGRRFGQLIRNRFKDLKAARPELHLILIKHGYEFIKALEADGLKRMRLQQEEQRKRRMESLKPHYAEYLKQQESTLQALHPGLYQDFLDERTRFLNQALTGPLAWSPSIVEKMRTDEARLDALVDMFKSHPVFPILEFSAWAKQNGNTVNSTQPPQEVNP